MALDTRSQLVNDVMAQRYGVEFNDKGEAVLEHETAGPLYMQCRRQVEADLRAMSPQALAYVRRDLAPKKQADPEYDPYAFAKVG